MYMKDLLISLARVIAKPLLVYLAKRAPEQVLEIADEVVDIANAAIDEVKAEKEQDK